MMEHTGETLLKNYSSLYCKTDKLTRMLDNRGEHTTQGEGSKTMIKMKEQQGKYPQVNGEGSLKLMPKH